MLFKISHDPLFLLSLLLLILLLLLLLLLLPWLLLLLSILLSLLLLLLLAVVLLILVVRSSNHQRPLLISRYQKQRGNLQDANGWINNERSHRKLQCSSLRILRYGNESPFVKVRTVRWMTSLIARWYNYYCVVFIPASLVCAQYYYHYRYYYPYYYHHWYCHYYWCYHHYHYDYKYNHVNHYHHYNHYYYPYDFLNS